MVLLKIILYPLFLGSLVFVSFIIALNGKRIRGKWKFDALPFYMIIYLANVAVVFGLMGSGVPLLVLSTILLLYVIVKVSKFQVLGITGKLQVKI